MKIDVIIPTYNRIESLHETLKNICKSKKIPDQIYIIDQTQDIEKKEKIKKIINFFPKLHINYIHLEYPSSTHARNVGIEKSKNQIIVFMDDDVDVYEDTFYNIDKIMCEHKNISMIAGINTLSESKKESYIGYLFGTKSIKKRNIGHVTYSMLGRFPRNLRCISDFVRTEWAMGYFFVVKRDMIEKYDIKFDEKLQGYAYAEDLDFTYDYYKKSELNNLECVITPLVKVIHNATKEWRIPTKKHTFIYLINRMYLHNKHFGNNIYKRLYLNWTNYSMLIYKIIHKDNVKDYIEGLKYCKKNKRKIRMGELDIKSL